jgi:8-oxo-dGTP diphosphatase
MLGTAGVIIVSDKGQVLAQHRDKNPGIRFPDYWCIPGGRLQPGEQPERGARRELVEETGYLADRLELLDERDVATEEGVIRQYVYWARYDGKQKIRCFEGQEVKFVTPERLAALKVQREELELFSRVATSVPVGFYQSA